MKKLIFIDFYFFVLLFNMYLFIKGSFIDFVYGIILIVLGTLTLYCLLLINKDILKSSKIAIIIGTIMSLLMFIEGVIYGEGFLINYHITGLFIMVGGILIFNAGKKVIKADL